MKGADIVQQLARFLPVLVNDFTNNYNVTSILRSGTNAVAQTDTSHDLVIGSQVNITGAQTPITISSITRVGSIATMVTASDHDVTDSSLDDFVEITGASEPEFNGQFTRLSVPNRRTILFQVANSGPTTATGSPLLQNGSNPFAGFNGLKEVTAVPTADTFEYTVEDRGQLNPNNSGIVAKTLPRIAHAVDGEAVLKAYTQQPSGDGWLFVVLGDAVANKSRRIDTDAVDNIQAGNFYNQRLLQNVTLHVYLPTSNEVAGAEARDRAQELLQPILQSIGNYTPPSLVSNPLNPLQITGHRPFAYNRAFYVHEYTFETTVQLGPGDVFVPKDDVAFRDIELSQTISFGTEPMLTSIDLDDEPL